MPSPPSALVTVVFQVLPWGGARGGTLLLRPRQFKSSSMTQENRRSDPGTGGLHLTGTGRLHPTGTGEAAFMGTGRLHPTATGEAALISCFLSARGTPNRYFVILLAVCLSKRLQT